MLLLEFPLVGAQGTLFFFFYNFFRFLNLSFGLTIA